MGLWRSWLTADHKSGHQIWGERTAMLCGHGRALLPAWFLTLDRHQILPFQTVTPSSKRGSEHARAAWGFDIFTHKIKFCSVVEQDLKVGTWVKGHTGETNVLKGYREGRIVWSSDSLLSLFDLKFCFISCCFYMTVYISIIVVWSKLHHICQCVPTQKEAWGPTQTGLSATFGHKVNILVPARLKPMGWSAVFNKKTTFMF